MDERIQRILVIIGALIILILFSWLKQRKKDRQPIYTYNATIRSKTVVKNTVKGIYGPKNVFSYTVIFDLADGSWVELTAPESIGRYSDGTSGTVIFQGTKCERFDPDQ